MINFDFRPTTKAENKYTFSQSAQISGQTGLIGYLRADMDSDGNGFFSTWFDFRADLKSNEFKAEFDDLINFLRKEGNFLHNRVTLADYCYKTPQSKMQSEMSERSYGVRVDTEKYAYLMRLNPYKGEYNLYCYCYVKNWLDHHMEKAESGIRFIDSNYNELFRIPDGGKIKIHVASVNNDMILTCRFIDDYHVCVDNSIYHIGEFAEQMEHAGNTYEPVLVSEHAE